MRVVHFTFKHKLQQKQTSINTFFGSFGLYGWIPNRYHKARC